MRHHHHRSAQVVAQLQDQAVQPSGVHRVQARAGFVQKQQRRVQRQRPRQAGALAHAATQLRRHEVERTVQPHQRQLEPRHLFACLVRQRREQAQRQHHVFADRHRTPQGTRLEQHAKALAQAAQRGFVTVVEVLAFDQHMALLRRLQADQVAQQRTLAAAAGAQDDEDFCLRNRKVDVMLNHLFAMRDGQVYRLHDGDWHSAFRWRSGFRHGVRDPGSGK